MGRLIVENAAVAGKSLPPPTDISAGLAGPVWNGYPNPVDADERLGGTASGLSHVIPYPTNLAVGDLVYVAVHANHATVVPIITWPPALAELAAASRGSGAGGQRGAVAWRRVDGTEGASFTITTALAVRVAYHALRITDAHPVTPPEAAGRGSVGNGATVEGQDPIGWGAEQTLWLAWIGAANWQSIVAWPPSYPGDRTQLWLTHPPNDKENRVGLCYAKLLVAAAPTFGESFGVTGNTTMNYVTITTAVRPRPA